MSKIEKRLRIATIISFVFVTGIISGCASHAPYDGLPKIPDEKNVLRDSVTAKESSALYDTISWGINPTAAIGTLITLDNNMLVIDDIQINFDVSFKKDVGKDTTDPLAYVYHFAETLKAITHAYSLPGIVYDPAFYVRRLMSYFQFKNSRIKMKNIRVSFHFPERPDIPPITVSQKIARDATAAHSENDRGAKVTVGPATGSSLNFSFTASDGSIIQADSVSLFYVVYPGVAKRYGAINADHLSFNNEVAALQQFFSALGEEYPAETLLSNPWQLLLQLDAELNQYEWLEVKEIKCRLYSAKLPNLPPRYVILRRDMAY